MMKEPVDEFAQNSHTRFQEYESSAVLEYSPELCEGGSGELKIMKYV
jgi:hypothetical protein